MSYATGDMGYLGVQNPHYAVGDLIAYKGVLGGMITVTVTTKEANIKNGRPGFTGRAIDGTEAWGYDSQIRRIRKA